MGDQGRLEDPHLWERCRGLGIDLERFEADRRGPAAAERVERDFRAGIRAGVVSTPTLFVAGEPHPGIPGRTAGPAVGVTSDRRARAIGSRLL